MKGLNNLETAGVIKSFHLNSGKPLETFVVLLRHVELLQLI